MMEGESMTRQVKVTNLQFFVKKPQILGQEKSSDPIVVVGWKKIGGKILKKTLGGGLLYQRVSLKHFF